LQAAALLGLFEADTTQGAAVSGCAHLIYLQGAAIFR